LQRRIIVRVLEIGQRVDKLAELLALLQLLQRILDAPCELFVALQEAQESRPRDAPAKAFLEARWRGGGPG
jgi:hypothetical protein